MLDLLLALFGSPVCWARRKHAWGPGGRWSLSTWPVGDVPEPIHIRHCRICGKPNFHENPDFTQWVDTQRTQESKT